MKKFNKNIFIALILSLGIFINTFTVLADGEVKLLTDQTNIKNGATDVPTGSDIILVFDKNVGSEDVFMANAGRIKVVDDKGNTVSVEISPYSSEELETLKIKPVDGLKKGTNYHVMIEKGISSEGKAESTAADYEISFKTEGTPEPEEQKHEEQAQPQDQSHQENQQNQSIDELQAEVERAKRQNEQMRENTRQNQEAQAEQQAKREAEQKEQEAQQQIPKEQMPQNGQNQESNQPAAASQEAQNENNRSGEESQLITFFKILGIVIALVVLLVLIISKMRKEGEGHQHHLDKNHEEPYDDEHDNEFDDSDDEDEDEDFEDDEFDDDELDDSEEEEIKIREKQ